MKVKNKNKSKDGQLHKCDFCGDNPEEIWMHFNFDGQYCLKHFNELVGEDETSNSDT